MRNHDLFTGCKTEVDQTPRVLLRSLDPFNAIPAVQWDFGKRKIVGWQFVNQC